MKSLIIASIVTVILFLVNFLIKKPMEYWRYVILFILILVFNYAFSEEVSNKNSFPTDVHILVMKKLEMKYEKGTTGGRMRRDPPNLQALPQEQLTKEYCLKQAQFHRQEGARTYKDAKELCWWLPNLDQRQVTRMCFETAAALMVPADPMSKLVAATAVLLVEYGIDCIDEWHTINNKLYWSEYHFEVAEHYEFLASRM
jgi:hypothetical protein